MLDKAAYYILNAYFYSGDYFKDANTAHHGYELPMSYTFSVYLQQMMSNMSERYKNNHCYQRLMKLVDNV